MRLGRARVTILAIALGSCGGGGGGSSSPVVSTPSPQPSPTPTPSPTPAPSPTPSPTATYDVAFDLSRDRFFNLTGAELDYVVDTRGTSPAYSGIVSVLQNSLIGPSLTYTAGNQRTVLTQTNGTNEAFERSQLSTQSVDRITYQTADGFLALVQPGPSAGNLPASLRYVIGIVQNRQVRNAAGNLDAVERRYVSGSTTAAAEVPTTGTARYVTLLTTVTASTTGVETLNAENVELSVDFSARTISGTITGQSTSGTGLRVTLTFTGQLGSGGGRFNGTVTSSDGGTGTFTGDLYGPAGSEIGLALRLTQGGRQLIGTVVGVRR